MADFSTSNEETGLHEGPMPAWKPKKGKSLSPAEMLPIYNPIMNADTVVLSSNGTKFLE